MKSKETAPVSKTNGSFDEYNHFLIPFDILTESSTKQTNFINYLDFIEFCKYMPGLVLMPVTSLDTYLELSQLTAPLVTGDSIMIVKKTQRHGLRNTL